MAKDQGWQLQGSPAEASTRFYSKVRRAARVADARRRESYSFGEDYESLTKQELYVKAKEKEVPGRSNMNKRDLVRALRRY